MFALTTIVNAQQTQRFSEPEATYQEALKLFQKEKYRAAQIQFNNYLVIDNNSLKMADAQFHKSICALYLEQPDAENQIVFFVENNAQHPKAGFAYYELGNYYYQNKNYNKVIEFFEEIDTDILSEEEKNNMRFKLAYSYFSKKDFDRAKQNFDRVKTKKHKYRAASYYYSGYIAYEQENYNEALSNFNEIKNDASYKNIVTPNIAKIYYKSEKYDKLINLLSDQKSIKGETALYLGEAYYFKKDYQKAKKYYSIYFSTNKYAKDEVNYRMAYTLMQSKDYTEAVTYFSKSALRDDELGQNSAYNLGICYLKIGNKPYALGAFLHASDLDFDKKIKEESLVSYAKINYENKNYTETIKILGKLNKEFPNSIHYKENEELLTDAYVNSNNFYEAIKYLESISEKSYREKKAYQLATYRLGVRSYNEKKYELALNYFQKSLKYPITKELILGASYWTAETYSYGKKYAKAITNYSRIFENDPLKTSDFYLKTRYGIAYAYYNTKDYSKAITHFKYYSINSKDKDLYYLDAVTRLADCYYVTKDYNAAITNYKVVKGYNKLHIEYVTFQLGIINYLTDRTEEAKKELEDVINNYPKSPYLDDALYQRALIDLETGSYATAAARFSDFIDNKSNSSLLPQAYSKRIICYGNLNQHEKEFADYDYIFSNHITHPIVKDLIKGLNSVLIKVGKEDDFKTYLDKYKAANPLDSDLKNIEYESAKSLYYAERYKSAITNLEDFISTYPTTVQSFEGQYLLAEAYRKENREEKALESYEKVILDNNTDFVIRSIYKSADIYFDSKQYQKAIVKYEMLYDRAQREKEMVKALTGLTKSYYELKDYEKAESYAVNLVASNYANEYTINEAKLYQAKSDIYRGNFNLAKPVLDDLVATTTDEFGAEANYLIALNMYENKLYKESKDELYLMNKRYGTYDLWLGKCFILIAQNLIALEEDFQAKATLTSVIDNSPIEEVVSEAKEILDSLETKVDEQKEEIEEAEEEAIEIETLEEVENE